MGWGCGGMRMAREGDVMGWGRGGMGLQWDGDAVGRDHRSQSHQPPLILPAGCLLV